MTAILVLAAIVTLGTGVLNALELYFVQDNLGAGPEWLGIINAFFGGGVLVGAFIGGRMADRVSNATVVWIGACAFNAGLGVSLGAFNSSIFPLIQRIVPRDLLARVGSVINPVIQSANLVAIGGGSVLAGTLMFDFDATFAGIHFGAIDTMFFVGGLLCLVAGIYAAVALRRTDTDTDTDQADTTSTVDPDDAPDNDKSTVPA